MRAAPSDPDAVASALAELAAKVDARMVSLLDADGLRWEKVDPELQAPLAALRRLVTAGGKRLRPAF